MKRVLSAFYREGVLEAGCDEAGRGCLAGPMVLLPDPARSSSKIGHPFFTYDLAPTVAWLFGFQLNE